MNQEQVPLPRSLGCSVLPFTFSSCTELYFVCVSSDTKFDFFSSSIFTWFEPKGFCSRPTHCSEILKGQLLGQKKDIIREIVGLNLEASTRRQERGNCLAVQWLGLCEITAKSLSLIPGLLLLFRRSVVSDFLRPRGLQHARLPCPSLSPRACSKLVPLSQ